MFFIFYFDFDIHINIKFQAWPLIFGQTACNSYNFGIIQWLLSQQLMQAISYSQWQIQQVLYDDSKTSIELIRHLDSHLIRKRIDINYVGKLYAEHQLKFMMEIKHPNVVTYIHHQFHKGKLNIYMPYYQNSDLHNFLTRNNPSFEERMRMFIDILVGLQQLHSRFIIHRDIKLKNIFLTVDKTCVIADLGIATTSVDSANSEVGTVCYNAPEIYSEDDYYNQKVDIWAMGIIAYQLFNARNGKVPFPFLEPEQMLAKINVYGGYIDYNSYMEVTSTIFPCCEDLPAEIKTMISRMLQNDPKKRIGWSQFYRQGTLSKYDLQDRLCTFKAEYLLMEDTKASYKRSHEQLLKFKTMYFYKLRHILSMEHRDYFENKYPQLKKEIKAVYRVYLRFLRESIDYYNEIIDKKIYKLAKRLKPFYKAIARQISEVEPAVRYWSKETTTEDVDYESNEYFHTNFKMVVEMLNDMDAADFKDMQKQ